MNPIEIYSAWIAASVRCCNLDPRSLLTRPKRPDFGVSVIVSVDEITGNNDRLWLQEELTVDSLPQFGVLDTLNIADEILNDSFLVTRLAANDLPQRCRLNKIIVGDLTGIGGNLPGPLFVFGVQGQSSSTNSLLILVEFGRFDRGANVVRVAAVITVKSHGSVTLERAVDLDLRGVSGKLLVVDTEAVAGCIGVCKESCLQHLRKVSQCESGPINA